MKQLFGPAASPFAINIWLLVLRILSSGFMFTHGIPKLTKILNGNFTFGDPLGIGSAPSLILATLAEVGCTLLVLIGFQTRLATIPIMFTMFVAGVITNWEKSFKDMELALLYLLIYATLFFLGAGKYSVDGNKGARRFS
jgi:putative oxidoreductase